MARLNAYRIQFYSFGNGVHEFDFEVDESFFAFFEDSELEKGKVDVHVVMNKTDQRLQFDISVHGMVEVICDWCLEGFEQEIDRSYTLFGKFGEGNSEEEYDVVWIPHNSHEVDLANYIFEYIVLSLPMKKVHPAGENGETGCNEDMLDRLDDMVVYTDE